MTADVSENVDQEKLLGDFKARYQQLLEDNKKMVDQIKANENQALKLLGAIETLEYLAQPDEVDNCLLYTSPSPRDGLLSRMPSSA